jgi:E3 ubiquitin-protein ligase listerin
MSKKPLRSAASSGRAASGSFASPSGFGSHGPSFGSASSSSLSYIAEPPDLSTITDPQIVVAFKNLLKKDAVTKAKALEEIKDYLSRADVIEKGVEGGLLEAWVGRPV